MSEEKLVPKLRFAGFNEEWKSFRLNEISERITRKNKSLETDRPLTISAQYGLVDQIEYFNKIVASKSLKGYYLLNKGEFAYNKSYSNGYPFGAVKRLDNYENGAISTLYICFSVNNNMNSELLKEYFETDKWYKEIYKIAVEGARNHGLLNIAVGDFFNTKHILPTNNKEQEKIAKFLIELNKKIELLEKKLKNYQDFKKYLMQQIFAQKLRFADYSDDWKEVALKDIGTFYRGHSYNSTNVVDNGLLVLRSNNIQNNVLDFSEDGLQFVDKDCKKELELQKNDIVICMSNGTRSLVGKSAEYTGNYANRLTVGAFCSIFRTKNKLAKYLFQTESYKKNLYLILAGTNINNLKNTDLEKFKFNIPVDESEINKIHDLFTSIDNKIESNQKQLQEIMVFKKGLLQQMFV